MMANSIRLGPPWEETRSLTLGSRCPARPGCLHPRKYARGMMKERLLPSRRKVRDPKGLRAVRT